MELDEIIKSIDSMIKHENWELDDLEPDCHSAYLCRSRINYLLAARLSLINCREVK